MIAFAKSHSHTAAAAATVARFDRLNVLYSNGDSMPRDTYCELDDCFRATPASDEPPFGGP